MQNFAIYKGYLVLCETRTDQQVAQLLDSYMIMMMMMIMMTMTKCC
jgi:hypothetical protein